MDSYGGGRRGCIDCNCGVVRPSSLSFTVRYYALTFRTNESCTLCCKADLGHGRLGAVNGELSCGLCGSNCFGAIYSACAAVTVRSIRGEPNMATLRFFIVRETSRASCGGTFK